MGRSVNPESLARLTPEERQATLRKRFDAAWSHGKRPRISDFLLKVPANERPGLFAILADIDVFYRKRRGDDTSLSDYVNKFPYESSILKHYINIMGESDQPGIHSTQTFPRFRSSIASPSGPEVFGEIDPGNCLFISSELKQLGRYLIRELIGRGGFGEVYRGFDTRLEREVAIKTVRQKLLSATGRNESLLAEGKKVASLECAGIVRVYDADYDQGMHFLVYELVAGGSLTDRMMSKRYEWQQTATVVAEIADALHFAHQKGIFHRDLKPQNILIDSQGKPRIADFGLAATEDEQLLESAGELGTLIYMAPEVLRGGGNIAGERSDIYGLGCILYEMLTDRRLYKANTKEQCRQQVLDGNPRSPRLIDDKIPVEIENICLKCLSKDPSNRHATAADVAKELRTLVAKDAADRIQKERAAQFSQWKKVAVACTLIAAGVAAGTSIPSQTPEKVNTPVEVRESRYVTDFNDFPPKLSRTFNTRPTKWLQLLDQTPAILIWPDQKKSSSIRYDRQDLEIFASCDRLGLIELGQTDQPDFEVRVSLQQNGWSGDFGVFMGFEDALDFAPNCKRCHLFIIQREAPDLRSKLRFMVSDAIVTPQGDILSERESQVPGTFDIPANQETVAIEIRKRRLHLVRFGAKQVDITPDMLPYKRQREISSGRFGVFCLRSSALFRGYHIRFADSAASTATTQK